MLGGVGGQRVVIVVVLGIGTVGPIAQHQERGRILATHPWRAEDLHLVHHGPFTDDVARPATLADGSLEHRRLTATRPAPGTRTVAREEQSGFLGGMLGVQADESAFQRPEEKVPPRRQ